MSVGVKYQVDKIVEKLVGATITTAITSPPNSFGDEFYGFMALTPDEKEIFVWVLRDEEGNGPGALEYDPND